MPTIYPLPTGMTLKASLTASETTRPASQNLFNKGLPMVKTNPTQSNNTFARLVAKVNVKIVIPAAAILGFLSYGFQTAFHSQQLEPPPQVQLRLFGRAEYEQLRIGMSLTDVRSILSRGVEVSRSATIATFLWENPDGSKIIVTFEHDKLKSKEQSGLK
ncbi:MAG: hypothetical protein V7K41_12370 [Nostoc sp.]|uniref:hypothetical protein n=1 Tax=Nostoc sp. TaxID=1180 RepID=UPI002FFA7928